MGSDAGLINLRADWVSVIEAIHAPAIDDQAWADGLIDAARPLFPGADHVYVYSLAYDADLRLVEMPLVAPLAAASFFDGIKAIGQSVGSEAWAPYHFGLPVTTHLEVARTHPHVLQQVVRDVRVTAGFSDGLGVVGHPRPGLVTVLSAMYARPIELHRHERDLLARIAMHIDAGQRLRQNPNAVIAHVDARGRIDTANHSIDPERIAEAAARITRARTRSRRLPEATELWTALLNGRMSVVPRDRGFIVLDNPPSAHHLRALTPGEVAVLALAARGTSAKQICYALGISPTQVSVRLRSAASKVGVLSRTELVRLAALLAQDPKGLHDDASLTEAEEEVLHLLERGFGNEEIAKRRMRSVRTIANQVASLLRKTGAASRRELVARAAVRTQ